MRLARVILATDGHRDYYSFWPIAARAWARRVGVRPTLAVIGARDLEFDERHGDVVRFDAVPGIDTGLQAQLIRLLLPVLFPADVSLIADIDMLPLQRRFFTAPLRRVRDDAFVVYRDAAYAPGATRYPMCYNAALGSTFGEVFGLDSIAAAPAVLARWAAPGLGWHTDELLLYAQLQAWDGFDTRCVRLGGRVERRIDRTWWSYWPLAVRARWYIDSHLPRPYEEHRAAINQLVATAAL